MPNKEVLLANYYEEKMLIVDTAKLDANGKGVFRKNNKKLARGLYLVALSRSSYFDLIIGDNQNFSIKADTINILEKLQFDGSPENTAFLNFQEFMIAQNAKTKSLAETYNKDPKKDNPEVKKKYNDQFEFADREVRAYIEQIGKQFPGSALATFTAFILSPVIPDFSKEIAENTPDRNMEIQRCTYYYNKDHYWDYTYFNDSTLIRTPGFKKKINDYLNDMIIQQPDTVFREAVNIIEKSKDSRAMFRYLVSTFFNYTLESKIMGMDKAFVNIAKKYYLSGRADWVDPEAMEKIKEEVVKLQYNLIGMKAQELKLPSMDGGTLSLYETKAPFTLLLFWEADCGHCKKIVPGIKTELLDKFKPYGLKVFAVHTQNKKDEWEKFVIEYNLFDFINCWDPHNQTNYRIYYNVFTTPTIYLLDKDKKIIAKKLDVEQLTDLLKREYKKEGINIP